MNTKLIWITQAELKTLVDYNPVTGIFTHKKSYYGSGGKVGRPAGSLCSKGYVIIRLNKKNYKAHRLAFLYMTGKFPENQVDHINGNKSDNSWENLRAATQSENMCNIPSKDIVRGVYFNKKTQKWVVSISKNNVRYNIGSFTDLELAELVAIEAKDKYHKEFANNVCY